VLVETRDASDSDHLRAQVHGLQELQKRLHRLR
jgi:hypothetical protein